MNAALILEILALLPKIKNYTDLLPEAVTFLKQVYDSVSRIIAILKEAPLDDKGQEALDALIEWQSQQPWGNIEDDTVPPIP